MPESCMIYEFSDAYYVYSQGKTQAGLGVTVEPFFKVSKGASDVALGGVALLSARSYRPSMPDLDGPATTDMSRAMFRFAGARSWSAFLRNAGALVDVVLLSNNLVKITPYNKDQHGFVPAAESSRIVSEEAGLIGESIRDRLAK